MKVLLPAVAALLFAGQATAQVTYEPRGQDEETVDEAPLSQPVVTPEDAPLQLVPQRVRDGIGVGPQPVSDRPNQGSGINTPAQPLRDGYLSVSPGTSDVAMDGLDGIDPSGIGILTEEDGGFRRDMWRGSDRAVLVALMPKLPVNVTSPTMLSLARRLLLTGAAPPAMSAADTFAGTEPDSNDLLRARVERLVAGGNVQALAALFERVPAEIDDEVITRARVDAALLTGDLGGACAEADAANERGGDAYWFQVVAFCRVIDGNASGATFATDMLRDMGVNDPGFFALMNQLTIVAGGSKATEAIGSIGTATPLKLAMLRKAGINVPVEALVQASPLLLRSIATTPNMPANLRLEAADTASRQGALGAERLAAIYGGASFSAEEIGNAVLVLDAIGQARGNALIYQAARRTPAPMARARLLEAAWERGRNAGTYLLTAETNIEATRALPVSLDLFEVAPSVTKALLAAGDSENALRWYDLVRSQASAGDLEATAALLELWPFMQVTDGAEGVPFSEDILDLWWQAQLVQPRPERARRGALVFAVFEALGKPVPETYWTGLYEGAERADYSMPPLAVWRGAVAAGRSDRLGEAVLLSLAAVGGKGAGAANPAVLANVIETLRLVGLESEARSLALEALLEAGL